MAGGELYGALPVVGGGSVTSCSALRDYYQGEIYGHPLIKESDERMLGKGRMPRVFPPSLEFRDGYYQEYKKPQSVQTARGSRTLANASPNTNPRSLLLLDDFHEDEKMSERQRMMREFFREHEEQRPIAKNSEPEPRTFDKESVKKLFEKPYYGLVNSPGLHDDTIWINYVDPPLPKLRTFVKREHVKTKKKKKLHFAFAKVRALTKINRLKVMKEVESGLPLELILPDVQVRTRSGVDEERAAIDYEMDVIKMKEEVFKFFDEMREMFYYWAPMGGSAAPNSMNLNQFLQFARMCRITNKYLTNTVMSRIFIQVNLEIMITRMEDGPAATKFQLVEDEDNPDNELILPEFVEMLVRCCMERSKKDTSTPLHDKFSNFMNRYILPYAMQDVHLSRLTRTMTDSPEILKLLTQYQQKIKTTFRTLCETRKNFITEETTNRWLTAHKMFGKLLTRREAHIAFAAAQDENEIAYGRFILKWPEWLEYIVRIGDLRHAVDDVYATSPDQLSIHFQQFCEEVFV